MWSAHVYILRFLLTFALIINNDLILLLADSSSSSNLASHFGFLDSNDIFLTALSRLHNGFTLRFTLSPVSEYPPPVTGCDYSVIVNTVTLYFMNGSKIGRKSKLFGFRISLEQESS